jgi:integrase
MAQLRRPVGPYDWVFPESFDALNGKWKPYSQWIVLTRFRQSVRRAGMDAEEYIFHDLRATFAVNAHLGGTPLSEIQAILGHSSPHMTLEYAKLAKKKSALNSLHRITGQLIPEKRAQHGPNLVTAA